YLVGPLDGTLVEVERQDGVGHLSFGVGVRIARARVDQLAVRVDGGRGPDAAARRTVQLSADGALAGGLGSVGDDVRLPKDFAGGGVHSHQAAAEGAALVFGHGGREFLD